MAEQWQIRRGTTAQNDSFTGAVGEITMDTDENEIRIHDGTTQGGKIIANKNYVDNSIETALAANVNAEIVGNLNINGSEVSNFGFRQNLVLSNVISFDTSGITSFEIVGSFTTPATFDSKGPWIIQGIKENTSSLVTVILVE